MKSLHGSGASLANQKATGGLDLERILNCITQEHDFTLLVVAVLVCVAGSCLSVRVSRRLRLATTRRRRVQLGLSGLLAGATIWSTHFIAMLAYDPGVYHGYAPGLTGASFVVAVLGTYAANAAFTYKNSLSWTILGGVVFGITVSTMHYIGMMAYQIPGYIVWDTPLKAFSVILGAVLGAAAFHRIVYPVTRYCWLGGAVFMCLSIIATHLIGMSAISLELSPLFHVPPQILSDQILGFLVFGVTAIILAVGFAALSIETTLENEAMLELAHSATHDHLTGIPNRQWLSQFFTAFAEASDTKHLAVVAIDLDAFKAVNDLSGHAAGDRVLHDAAQRLTAVCRTNEYVARTGGDEFTAIKVCFDDEAEVIDFAERLSATFEAPIDDKDFSVQLGGSLGVATTLRDGRAFNDLMQKADFAMYRAKASADINLCLYDAAMDEQSREKLMLINDLRSAMINDEFELVYQLQHELTGVAPIGCEVLLRWRHPVRGMVSPGEFIPLAEETGFIRDIGLWVLRTACLEAASWTLPFGLAVNVAPQQLVQPNFIEALADVLTESQLPPGRLELEVTEASVISDQAGTLEIINKIKAMGVRIAMDDFGTGYSSLATLQSFPFDKIKVDRSFITDVHCNEQRSAIVRATLLLGKSLGIPVLAEGVEEEAELKFLQDEGCDFVQGFYFGRPLDLKSIRAIVHPQAVDAA